MPHFSSTMCNAYTVTCSAMCTPRIPQSYAYSSLIQERGDCQWALLRPSCCSVCAPARFPWLANWQNWARLLGTAPEGIATNALRTLALAGAFKTAAKWWWQFHYSSVTVVPTAAAWLLGTTGLEGWGKQAVETVFSSWVAAFQQLPAHHWQSAPFSSRGVDGLLVIRFPWGAAPCYPLAGEITFEVNL